MRGNKIKQRSALTEIFRGMRAGVGLFSQFPNRDKFPEDLRGSWSFLNWDRCSVRNVTIVAGALILTISLVFLQSAKTIEPEKQHSTLDYTVSSQDVVPPSDGPEVTKRAESSPRGKDRDFSPNNGTWFVEQSIKNSSKSGCHTVGTTGAKVFRLEKLSLEGNIRLPTDEDHDIILVAFDQSKKQRCSGGDYFETDLDGTQWKSRPPVKDLGNGEYVVKLRVDGRFAGSYRFQIILLFNNWHGLDTKTEIWAKFEQITDVTIEFFNQSSEKGDLLAGGSGTLRLCSQQDFKLFPWRGQWTRTKANENCVANPEGRWLCLKPEEPCDLPWCEGPVGRLESNGWAYSAHCHFRIFTLEEAWQCLNGRRLFFWGDSNHQDTSRNLINFLLGLDSGILPRSYDRNFTNPSNSSEVVRLTVLFNGHFIMKYNNMGLTVLNVPEHTKIIESIFTPSGENPLPDVMILNSGIHDGIWWKHLTHHASAAQNASQFWSSIWKNTSDDQSKRPKVVYRTTVAPAGTSRAMAANPQKMEVLNNIMVENMLAAIGRENLRIVDEFDMTFPFHFDHANSDGGHYGRIPNGKGSWWPGGHQYFVDVMLAHILLNSVCPLS